MRKLLYLLLLPLCACAVESVGVVTGIEPGVIVEPQEVNLRVDIELSAGEAIVSRSMDDFGLRLLGELGLASGAKENVFISPLSAGIALGMLNNGAKGGDA